MTTLREAAQQALEALENDAMQRTYAGGVRITNAAIALREALAEPEQEPLPWSTREHYYEHLDRVVENMRERMRIRTVTMRCKDFDLALPVIDVMDGHVLVAGTTPTPRKPLHDMAVFDLADEHLYEGGKNYGVLAFARAIERAHGITGETK